MYNVVVKFELLTVTVVCISLILLKGLNFSLCQLEFESFDLFLDN
jgi:hypothetical protein